VQFCLFNVIYNYDVLVGRSIAPTSPLKGEASAKLVAAPALKPGRFSARRSTPLLSSQFCPFVCHPIDLPQNGLDIEKGFASHLNEVRTVYDQLSYAIVSTQQTTEL